LTQPTIFSYGRPFTLYYYNLQIVFVRARVKGVVVVLS